ncbi:MAG: class I SAM-dependent methyltransferase [Eubacteriales bacterium]|nr:class I SAM-dependent methyltransferase [Eubacteriales bacterium]
METFEALDGYYGTHNEDARLMSRHGSVEFLTTVRYIEKYLKTGMKILEIGAATGQYSHYFARNGFTVDAVELIPRNIELFKEKTEPGEKTTVYQGNAVDLNFLSANTYDITLILGPMYHLFCEKDKLSALSEALRVTKHGGIVFAAYCIADASIIGYGFLRGNVKALVNSGMLDPITFQTHSEPKDVFELYRKADIDALMLHFNVTRLNYIGTDMVTNFMRETVDAMDDETFALFMKYHFSICEREDLIGATHHSLDIFRKDYYD